MNECILCNKQIKAEDGQRALFCSIPFPSISRREKEGRKEGRNKETIRTQQSKKE